MNNIAYIVTALSIIGTIANSFQKRWCFIIWAFTNSFWCVYNFTNKQYAQSLLYLFNLFLSFNGLTCWKKKQRASPNAKSDNGISKRIYKRRLYRLAMEGMKLQRLLDDWGCEKTNCLECKPEIYKNCYVRKEMSEWYKKVEKLQDKHQDENISHQINSILKGDSKNESTN